MFHTQRQNPGDERLGGRSVDTVGSVVVVREHSHTYMYMEMKGNVDDMNVIR